MFDERDFFTVREFRFAVRTINRSLNRYFCVDLDFFQYFQKREYVRSRRTAKQRTQLRAEAFTRGRDDLAVAAHVRPRVRRKVGLCVHVVLGEIVHEPVDFLVVGLRGHEVFDETFRRAAFIQQRQPEHVPQQQPYFRGGAFGVLRAQAQRLHGPPPRLSQVKVAAPYGDVRPHSSDGRVDGRVEVGVHQPGPEVQVRAELGAPVPHRGQSPRVRCRPPAVEQEEHERHAATTERAVDGEELRKITRAALGRAVHVDRVRAAQRDQVALAREHDRAPVAVVREQERLAVGRPDRQRVEHVVHAPCVHRSPRRHRAAGQIHPLADALDVHLGQTSVRPQPFQLRADQLPRTFVHPFPRPPPRRVPHHLPEHDSVALQLVIVVQVTLHGRFPGTIRLHVRHARFLRAAPPLRVVFQHLVKPHLVTVNDQHFLAVLADHVARQRRR